MPRFRSGCLLCDSNDARVHIGRECASKLALPAVIPFGARVLARGDAAVAREHGLKERTLVVEYPSLEKATAAYSCPAYAEALIAFGDGAVRDFRIVEVVFLETR